MASARAHPNEPDPPSLSRPGGQSWVRVELPWRGGEGAAAVRARAARVTWGGVHVQLRTTWWSVGAYFRLSDAERPVAVGIRSEGVCARGRGVSRKITRWARRREGARGGAVRSRRALPSSCFQGGRNMHGARQVGAGPRTERRWRGGGGWLRKALAGFHPGWATCLSKESDEEIGCEERRGCGFVWQKRGQREVGRARGPLPRHRDRRARGRPRPRVGDY